MPYTAAPIPSDQLTVRVNGEVIQLTALEVKMIVLGRQGDPSAPAPLVNDMPILSDARLSQEAYALASTHAGDASYSARFLLTDTQALLRRLRDEMQGPYNALRAENAVLSQVMLGAKRQRDGFHLALVEARNDAENLLKSIADKIHSARQDQGGPHG